MQTQNGVILPEELAEALDTRPDLRAVLDRMGPLHQREYAGWISGTRIEATRLRRVYKALIMIDQWGKEHPERVNAQTA